MFIPAGRICFQFPPRAQGQQMYRLRFLNRVLWAFLSTCHLISLHCRCFVIVCVWARTWEGYFYLKWESSLHSSLHFLCSLLFPATHTHTLSCTISFWSRAEFPDKNEQQTIWWGCEFNDVDFNLQQRFVLMSCSKRYKIVLETKYETWREDEAVEQTRAVTLVGRDEKHEPYRHIL